MSAEMAIVRNSSARVVVDEKQILQALSPSADTAFYETSTHEACVDLVRSISNRFEVIIAAGGDGTVNSVLEGIMQSNTRPRLGIIPLGTGNDFARGLGIPLDWRRAVDVLHSCRTRTVDVIHCRSSSESRWVANMITAGNTGRYLDVLTDDVKQQWGPLCYLRGVVTIVGNLESFRTSVRLDGGPQETFQALNLFFANGRTSGGGLDVSPDADLSDGLLDLTLVEDGDVGELAALGAEYVFRDFREHELVQIRRARQFAVEANPPLPLTADGDRIGETPLHVRVEPNALRVQVPKDEQSGDSARHGACNT